MTEEAWDAPDWCGTYFLWRLRVVYGWVWTHGRPDEQEQAVEWFIRHTDAPLDHVPVGTREYIEAARAAA